MYIVIFDVGQLLKLATFQPPYSKQESDIFPNQHIVYNTIKRCLIWAKVSILIVNDRLVLWEKHDMNLGIACIHLQ